MHTVALVIFDQISPFEMAVPREVFGTDRSDMGMTNYRLIVCAVEEGPLRTDAGFTIEAPYSLPKLREAQTIALWVRYNSILTSILGVLGPFWQPSVACADPSQTPSESRRADSNR
jgi:transcriptional regulator GlxA family with amidase domain